MRISALAGLCVVSVLLMAGGEAQAVLVTFDYYPGPDGLLGTADDVPIVAPWLFVDQPEQLTTQFASVGVVFLPDPPVDDVNEILDGATFTDPPSTWPNLLSTASSVGAITGRFLLPVRRISAVIGLAAGGNTLEIYDAQDNLIDSAGGDAVLVTLNSPVDIAWFRVVQNQPAIDDLGFDIVPEPATLGLLGLGLAGLIRRRKH